MGGRHHSSKLHSVGQPDASARDRAQPIYKTWPRSWIMCLQPLFGLYCNLQFPLCIVIQVFFIFRLGQVWRQPLTLNQTASLSFHVRVCTHALGVHKAASGACCYAAQSQGPKHDIAPLVCRCRCPRTHWCCTSGTEKGLPHNHGLRLLVWGGCKAEDTCMIQNGLRPTMILIYVKGDGPSLQQSLSISVNQKWHFNLRSQWFQRLGQHECISSSLRECSNIIVMWASRNIDWILHIWVVCPFNYQAHLIHSI